MASHAFARDPGGTPSPRWGVEQIERPRPTSSRGPKDSEPVCASLGT